MSTHQQSNPRRANRSITEESGRPSTCRSNVGCAAIEEPWTNRIVPALLAGSPPHFSNRKSFTAPSLVVQCSAPLMAAALLTSFMVHLSKMPTQKGKLTMLCWIIVGASAGGGDRDRQSDHGGGARHIRKHSSSAPLLGWLSCYADGHRAGKALRESQLYTGCLAPFCALR